MIFILKKLNVEIAVTDSVSRLRNWCEEKFDIPHNSWAKIDGNAWKSVYDAKYRIDKYSFEVVELVEIARVEK